MTYREQEPNREGRASLPAGGRGLDKVNSVDIFLQSGRGDPVSAREQESLAGSGKSFHIRVQLSAALCRYAGCPSELALSAATVGSALRQLEPSHPRLYRSICRESGAVRPHVNLFLNSDRIDELNGMETRLQSGDILTVLPAVSGGTPCRKG